MAEPLVPGSQADVGSTLEANRSDMGPRATIAAARAAMPSLYDLSSREAAEGLSQQDVYAGILNGTHSFQTDASVPVIAPDGSTGTAPGGNVAQLLKLGYHLDTAEGVGGRSFAQAHPIKAGVMSFAKGADEAFGGLAEGITKQFDPSAGDADLQAAYGGAVKANPGINTAGRVFGEVAPMVTGIGELGGLGAKAEGYIARGTAEKALQAGAEKLGNAGLITLADEAAPSLARQVAGRAANFGIQGGLTATPKAMGQLFNGDPGQAAETLLWGAGTGLLFGAAEGGLIAGASKLAPKLEQGLGYAAENADTVGAAVGKGVAGAAKGTGGAVGGYLGYKAAGAAANPLKSFVGDAVSNWLKGDGIQVGKQWLRQLAEEPFNTSFGQAMAAQGSSVLDQSLAKVPGILSSMGENAINAKVNKAETHVTEDNFDQVAKQVNAMNDPYRLQDITSHAASMLGRDSVSDQVATQLQGKMMATAAYLNAALPRNPEAPGPFQDNVWKPTPQELQAFNEKLGIVHDPLSVFHRLQDGTLTANHVDALQSVYPQVMQQVQKAVVETAGQPNAPVLPYPARVKLGKLVGVPLDNSVKNVARIQASFQQQEPAPSKSAPGGMPAKGTNLKLTVPVSDTQRVGGGRQK